MSRPLFPPSCCTREQRITHLQDVQRRSQAFTDALECRDQLSAVELNRLDTEHHWRRARQMLLWHLQGDEQRLRIFSDWPTFLIDQYRQQSVH